MPSADLTTIKKMCLPLALYSFSIKSTSAGDDPTFGYYGFTPGKLEGSFGNASLVLTTVNDLTCDSDSTSQINTAVLQSSGKIIATDRSSFRYMLRRYFGTASTRNSGPVAATGNTGPIGNQDAHIYFYSTATQSVNNANVLGPLTFTAALINNRWAQLANTESCVSVSRRAGAYVEQIISNCFQSLISPTRILTFQMAPSTVNNKIIGECTAAVESSITI